MTARNKFGVHIVVDGSHDGYGSDLERCALAGQPLSLVKAMFDKGALGQAKSVSPRTYTIYRCSIDDCDFPPTEEGSWFWRSSAECRQSALDWMSKCHALWNVEREKVDAFELVNEPNPTDEKIDWFVEWSRYCLNEAERLGYRIAWGSFSTGCPTESQMAIMLPFVSELAQRGHVLAMHDGAVVPPFTFVGTATDPSSPAANSSLRYRWWKRLADTQGLPFPEVAITECYAYGNKGPAFYEDWKWYLTELARDDYVIGAAWYTLGNGGDFGNIAGKPMRLAVDKALEIDYGAIVADDSVPVMMDTVKLLRAPYLNQNNPIAAGLTTNDCGPACEAMIDLMHGHDRTVDEWFQATGAGGGLITIQQLIKAAEHFGYMMTYLSGRSPADLRAALDAGRPVIALVNAGRLWYCATTSPHFVLVVGYRKGTDVFFIHDPYFRQTGGGAFVEQPNFVMAWNSCAEQGNPNGAMLTMSEATVAPPPVTPAISGVGMGSARPLTPEEIEAVRISGVRAFKALTIQDPGEAITLIDQVRSVRPDMLIVARLMFPPDATNRTPFPPQVFVDYVGAPALQFYSRGVRHFEIHNEPNLMMEGCGWQWANGYEFAEWFLEVRRILSRTMDGLWGFPGLSPQGNDIPGVCRASDAFLQEARAAVEVADWLGAHSYWRGRGTGYWEMLSESGGMHWKREQRAFPAKPLYITEYSCNNPSVADAEKGAMYRDYVKELAGVMGAFAFCLSWDDDWNHEGWVRSGAMTDIPRAMGVDG